MKSRPATFRGVVFITGMSNLLGSGLQGFELIKNAKLSRKLVIPSGA